MRCRHLGPFPFRVTDAVNPAYVVPVVWTLQDAIKYWWRLRTMTIEMTADVTYDGSTRTLTRTMTAVRSHGVPGFFTTVGANDELRLCHPGQDKGTFYNDGTATWFVKEESEAITSWGGSDADHPALTDVAWTFKPQIFANDHADIESRGAFADPPTSISPALNIYCALTLNDSLDNVASSVIISNIPETGSVTETNGIDLFGDTFDGEVLVTNNDTTFPPISYGGITATNVSVTLTAAGYFAYNDQDSANPVWNTGTGAQILNPLTATVP